jgi:hypothetical protein
MDEQSVHEQLEREWRDLVAPPAPAPPAPGEVGGAGPAALFAEIEDVRFEWAELRASPLLAGRLGTPVTGTWTLEDVAAHLASWARELRSQVETVAHGGTFDYAIPFGLSEPGHHRWNHAQVEARRGRTLEEVMDEFDAETRRMQEIVLTLPDERLRTEAEFPLRVVADPPTLWRTSIAQMVLGKCMHDRHHLARMQQWLGGSGGPEERS